MQVVFARGTGEPPGAGRVGDAFTDSLRSLVNGRSVAVYGVQYPASYDFMRAIDGVDDAAAFMQNTAQACPQTQMVLGGYSQGAAVVDVLAATDRPILGFTSPLPDAIADHVAAVVVFGNPSNRIGEPLTALSPLYGSRAIDLCNGPDPVCSDGNDVPAHSLYVEAGTVDQAAQFAAAKLRAPTPPSWWPGGIEIGSASTHQRRHCQLQPGEVSAKSVSAAFTRPCAGLRCRPTSATATT